MKTLIIFLFLTTFLFATDKNNVEIVIILDKSGSMSPIATETISNFNKFLNEQKCREDDANITLVLFDHTYDLQYIRKPIREAEELNNCTYNPDGFTALFDAVGKTITKIESRCDKSSNVIFVILTDGLENSSKEYTKKNLSKMIEEKQCKGWKFVFLGAGFNVFDEAHSLSIGTVYQFGNNGNVGVGTTYPTNSMWIQDAMTTTCGLISVFRDSVKINGIQDVKK